MNIKWKVWRTLRFVLTSDFISQRPNMNLQRWASKNHQHGVILMCNLPCSHFSMFMDWRIKVKKLLICSIAYSYWENHIFFTINFICILQMYALLSSLVVCTFGLCFTLCNYVPSCYVEWFASPKPWWYTFALQTYILRSYKWCNIGGYLLR
jgi:hypothetical protein